MINPICTPAGPVGGLGSASCGVLGSTSGLASSVTSALVLTPIVAWVVEGAQFVLHATVQVVAQTTAPQLASTWFSGTYWRVAGISAVLTLPFLFAAAVQALIRSDLSLLLRAALGYLPLALLGVTIAAPLTMLLLSASDELSAIVSSAAGDQSAHFLARATSFLGSVALTFSSPFVVFLVALLTVGGAVALWLELLVREAAVYVIVLMLPLAFAALVWPARRVWAVRAVELLIALILSKFAIVAVLALGGAALGHAAGGSVTALLTGAVLMALAALAPWALLRLVPLTELASAAAGSLSDGSHAMLRHLQRSDAWATEGDLWSSKVAQMARAAGGSDDSSGPRATKENVDANAGAGDGRASGTVEDHSRPGDGATPHAGAGAGTGAGTDGRIAEPTDVAEDVAPRSGAGAGAASGSDASPEPEGGASAPIGSRLNARPGAASSDPVGQSHWGGFPREEVSEIWEEAGRDQPGEASGGEIADPTPPPQPPPGEDEP